MSEWIRGLEGTEAGHTAALALAILAALLHALFGALQKGRHDPWLSRGAIDASYGLMAAPFALFVVPWPDPSLLVLGVAIVGSLWVDRRIAPSAPHWWMRLRVPLSLGLGLSSVLIALA